MNEYEGALLAAVAVLIRTVADLGADRAKLAEEFREIAALDLQSGNKGASAVAEICASLAEADTDSAEADRDFRVALSRRMFSVIPGDKRD
jgi:hypothetical protein